METQTIILLILALESVAMFFDGAEPGKAGKAHCDAF